MFDLLLHYQKHSTLCLLVACCCLSISCSTIISSASEEMAQNLSNAIRNQDDPETVRLGAPAYLIMVDGMIEGDPENSSLLATAANLYSSYTGIFIDDPQRRSRMASKAWQYAVRSLCLEFSEHCDIHKKPFDAFERFLPTINDKDDAGLLYTYGASWAGYIQANANDINAVADIPKVTAVFRHVQSLDDMHDNGGAHIYLGILSSLIPPSLGGKLDEAKSHFERAIEISAGKNLMVKVYFAERYARMAFNRALHDEILQDVMASDPRQPGMTLVNLLAQDKAKALLDSADEYF